MRRSQKNKLYLIISMLLLVTWLFKENVRSWLLNNVEIATIYHTYMLGVFFPALHINLLNLCANTSSAHKSDKQ